MRIARVIKSSMADAFKFVHNYAAAPVADHGIIVDKRDDDLGQWVWRRLDTLLAAGADGHPGCGILAKL